MWTKRNTIPNICISSACPHNISHSINDRCSDAFINVIDIETLRDLENEQTYRVSYSPANPSRPLSLSVPLLYVVHRRGVTYIVDILKSSDL